MKILDKYNNQQNSTKDSTLKKLPTSINQLGKKNTKNKNEKNINYLSIKNRRKPRYTNTFEQKTIKIHSHSKKNKNNQCHRNRIIIQPKQNMNKTICIDGHRNVSKGDDIHDRNLSAPYLKYQKTDETKINNNFSHINVNNYKKCNILKIKPKNRTISDNQNNHTQLDFNSFNESQDNSTLNDDKLYYIAYSNEEQIVPTIVYKPKNIDENEPLTKRSFGEGDNNYLNIHKNVLNIKNFYKNINNKKKPNHNYKTRIDISTYNKDIETIKNKRETIALLKEKIKMKDNNYNKNCDKPKLNKTINNVYNINLDTISNGHLNKKNTNKYFKSKKNINETNNNTHNDSDAIYKDFTQDRQAFTTRENINNINLSNSSNNKTATVSTNVTNNNGNGKNINIFNVYDSQTDEEKKELKENNNNYMNNNNLNNINNDKTRNKNNSNKEKNYTKENVINYKKDTQYNNIKNNDLSFNKNIIEKNKKQNYIYLQRSSKANDSNYLTKNINKISLNIKNKNNYNTSGKNKSKEKEKIIQPGKKVKKKNIDINCFNTKNNSERYNYFNDIYMKYKNLEYSHKKNNISSDNLNKKKENISKNNNNLKLKRKANSYIKKIISYKNDYIKDQSVEKDSDEKINLSKHLINCDFKNKSIDKIGVICKAGEIVFGKKKINQDNYFNCLINDDMRFIGVCDGHGDHGEHVSGFLRENLPKELEKTFNNVFKKEDNKINLLQKEMSALSYNEINLEENESSGNKNDNIFEIIKGVFEKTFLKTDKNLSLFCQNLNNNSKYIQLKDDESIFNVKFSGSTCASILLKEKNINKIYIANVGDSRAIIIKELKNKNNDWFPYQLTRDHKPTEQDEAQRVLEYDGEIEKIEDEFGEWAGPLRVWVKGSDGPGLAMTRSFGDEVATTVGVFSIPEVTEYKIKDEDRAIIIASDGLWEYLDNKSVADTVKKLIKQNDPDIIVNKLFKESMIQWRLNDQGIDDITIICILLKST